MLFLMLGKTCQIGKNYFLKYHIEEMFDVKSSRILLEQNMNMWQHM